MKKILLALDESPNARNVFNAGHDLAERTHAQIILFHAVSLPPTVPPEAYAIKPDDLAKMMIERARSVLDGWSKQLPAALVAGARVDFGAPWAAICEAAKAENADIIVIGSHGYGALDRLLGTTAAKVVNHADRSVLVVRPRTAA